MDQLRKPYEALGLTYDCASSQASPHQVRVYVSETFYEPFYPYISKELIDFIGLARVAWNIRDTYVSGIIPSKLYPTEASYIVGLERYIQTYPKSRYLLTEDFSRGGAEGGVTEGIVDRYNYGSQLFFFGAGENF